MNSTNLPKIAIFTHNICYTGANTINLFLENDIDISLIIIETQKRKKFTKSQREFKIAHNKFDEIISNMILEKKKKCFSIKSLLPEQLKSIIRKIILLIPIVNKYYKKRLEKFKKPNIDSYSMEIIAKKMNIPIEFVKKHSSQKTKDFLEKHNIDYVLLASSYWLIKEPLLSMKKTKIINAHCAKLPEHRSLDSLPWSIMENDIIGLTTHFIDNGIDTGNILMFIEVSPEKEDNLISLRRRVDEKIPEIFLKSILGLINGSIIPKPQLESEGTKHHPMIFEELVKAEHILQERIKKLNS